MTVLDPANLGLAISIISDIGYAVALSIQGGAKNG